MVATKNKPRIRSNGSEVDLSKVPTPLTIRHGRSLPNAQPDAPTAEFVYIGEQRPCVVGDRIEIEVSGSTPTWVSNAAWGEADTTWTGTSLSAESYAPRFVGTVTSVKALEALGDVDEWQISATGDLAKLGLINVRTLVSNGGVERPQETDSDRVAALATLGGVGIDVVGGPSLSLAAKEYDQSLLNALHEVCRSTGGLLWQTKDGSFRYGTSNHRAGVASFTIPAAAILDGVEWTKNVEEVLNSITIIWPAPQLPPPPITGEWTWNSSTDTGSDPGAGNFRANDADAGQITTLAVSMLTSDGADVTLSLSRRKQGDTLWVQQKGDSTLWSKYLLTNAPIDNGAWFTVQVEYVESGEAGPIGTPTAMLLSFDSREQKDTSQLTYTDNQSVSVWGMRHSETETMVANETEAEVLGLTILARRADPYWSMPGILIPFDDLSAAQASAVLSLEVSDGVLIPLSDDPGPTPSPVEQWAVEGWVEEWREDGYWMQLSVTDWARFSSAILRTYQVVFDTLTYGEVAGKTYQRLLAEVV